jgi:hypothetical protein
VQPTVVALHLQSKELSIRLRKPSAQGTGEAMSISLFANGGSRSEAAFHLSMCRNCRPAAAVNGAWVTSARSWDRADELRVSLDGLQVHWQVPPSTDAIIDMDAAASRFSFAKQYAFSIRLDCANQSQQSCVADGDTVETTVQLGGDTSSAASVITTVEALGSCLWSRASAEPAVNRVPAGAFLQFRIRVHDVDDLPVRYTHSDIQLEVDGVVLNRATSIGENGTWAEQVVASPPEVMQQIGAHLFRIVLSSGWNHETGSQADCVLLEHRVDIEEARAGTDIWNTKTAIIVAGVVFGVVAVVGALGCVCLCKWGHVKCLQSVIPGMGVSSRTVLFGAGFSSEK